MREHTLDDLVTAWPNSPTATETGPVLRPARREANAARMEERDPEFQPREPPPRRPSSSSRWRSAPQRSARRWRRSSPPTHRPLDGSMDLVPDSPITGLDHGVISESLSSSIVHLQVERKLESNAQLLCDI